MVKNVAGRKLLLIILAAWATCLILPAQDTSAVRTSLVPKISGILKTKVEYDLDNMLMRFEVRNARFGVQGNINDFMSYKLQIDLSDEGQMKMLDAYVRFTPVTNLNFYIGQRKIPFSSDYMRSPAENIFANRSFLAKYINKGMRDIGLYAEYSFQGQIPVSVVAGALNGTGNNNPQWISRPNLAARIAAGRDDGFRVTGNVYYGDNSLQHQLAMFGGEVRYGRGQFFVESEYITRTWNDTLSVRQHDDGMYIHAYYNFLTDSKMIKMITPVARYDMMGGSVLRGSTDATRFTCGVNIGFATKQFSSEIRFNYENYFKSSLPIHTDKVTIEFVGRF